MRVTLSWTEQQEIQQLGRNRPKRDRTWSLFFAAGFLAAVAVLAAGSSSASATVLALDDFSYVGPLTANGWVAHSGAAPR